MSNTTIHQPFVEFLSEASAHCESDAEIEALIDAIADTLGDMLGHQSDCYTVIARFSGRLLAAADAAAETQAMSKN